MLYIAVKEWINFITNQSKYYTGLTTSVLEHIFTISFGHNYDDDYDLIDFRKVYEDQRINSQKLYYLNHHEFLKLYKIAK